MRHVLIIAYYFPPLGLSGVQRIAGFVRHFPKYGWQPTVITAKPGGYFAHDESLWNPIKKEGICVIRTRSLDPTRAFRSGTTVRFPRESKRQALAKVSSWLFVPDNKAGWLPFAVRAGLRMAASQTFDAVFSSAPPYTGHLVGSILSKKLELPLIADFRDAWVSNPRHYYPTSFHYNLHVRQERRVLERSSAIIAINRPILDDLKKRHPDVKRMELVVPHGYDEESRPATNHLSCTDGVLRFVYTGVFYDAQVPNYFLQGLSKFLEQYPDMRTKIRATFAGLVPSGFEDLVRTLNLEEVVQYAGYLNHTRVMELQQKADVLWMTIGSRPGASGISTGKLFEYIGTGKPILALIPPGTARQTLRDYGAAYLAAPESMEDIIRALRTIREDWQHGKFPCPDEEFMSRFSRSRLTETLSRVLDSVTEQV